MIGQKTASRRSEGKRRSVAMHFPEADFGTTLSELAGRRENINFRSARKGSAT